MKKTSSGARVGEKRKNAKNPPITGKNASNREVMGYAVEGGKCGTEPPPEVARAAWISQELMEETRELWSPRYGRRLEDGEVIEILQNVRWFGELLRRGIEEGIV